MNNGVSAVIAGTDPSRAAAASSAGGRVREVGRRGQSAVLVEPAIAFAGALEAQRDEAAFGRLEGRAGAVVEIDAAADRGRVTCSQLGHRRVVAGYTLDQYLD